MIYDLFNSPGYLTPEEAMALARLFGHTSRKVLAEWAGASQEDGNGAESGEVNDPEATYGCKLGYLLALEDPTHQITNLLVWADDGLALKEAFSTATAASNRVASRRRAIAAALTDDARRLRRQESNRGEHVAGGGKSIGMT